jgi:two-component system, sensor histidine kinase and response regulator
MKNPTRNMISVQDESSIRDFPMNDAISGLIKFRVNLRHIFSSFFHLFTFSSIASAFRKLKSLGVTPQLEDYERRKLKVFNLLNFFQFIFGLAIPVSAAISSHKISTLGWIAACMPALVSVLVLFLNSRRNYEVSTLCYFILYPVITSIVYLSGMNLGIELFFILYGILAVFFIQDIGHMFFTVTLSMISYFILTVVWRNFQFTLEVNGTLYLFNHLIAIVFIFFGLFLVKKENAGYQLQLSRQAAELRELNSLKNKLFSVIAHDLKSPMYALRNIFHNIQKYDTPADDIKAMVPEVMKDLNYTTTLMENLLQWAKCQMQTMEVSLTAVNMKEVVRDAYSQLKAHAEQKNIKLINSIKHDVFVTGQQDMLQLVVRNLVSNAIKFTGSEGCIHVGAEQLNGHVEIFVKDSGIGIDPVHLQKIAHNEYFTTRGTCSEKGTGLGLMLCKEFLSKNNGTLLISSEPGVGSRFSFVLEKGKAS